MNTCLLCYNSPFGIIKDISSAIIPQSARYFWNITTHVVMMATHIIVPIIHLITSEKQENYLLQEKYDKVPANWYFYEEAVFSYILEQKLNFIFNLLEEHNKLQLFIRERHTHFSVRTYRFWFAFADRNDHDRKLLWRTRYCLCPIGMATVQSLLYVKIRKYITPVSKWKHNTLQSNELE